MSIKKLFADLETGDVFRPDTEQVAAIRESWGAEGDWCGDHDSPGDNALACWNGGGSGIYRVNKAEGEAGSDRYDCKVLHVVKLDENYHEPPDGWAQELYVWHHSEELSVELLGSMELVWIWKK